MTDITPDDPHTHRFPPGHAPSWQVVYWRGGVASGSKGADRAELEQFVPGNGYAGIGSFQLPADKPRLHAWLTALERAHAAGKRAKVAEIREMLEIGAAR